MTQLTIWILAAIALGFVVILARWQTYIQSVPAGLEFNPAQPQDFPRLNQNQLDQYTVEIASLGFSPIADYTVTAELGKLSPIFFRLFQNPEQYCHVAICQSFPQKGNSLSLGCWVVSFLGKNWILITTNARPNSLASITHLSDHLFNCRPNSSPTDLFQFHITQRKQITEALKVEAQQTVSTEAFLIKAKERSWRQKQIIKRQNLALSFVKAIWFNLRPRYEWLGDYPKAIATQLKENL